MQLYRIQDELHVLRSPTVSTVQRDREIQISVHRVIDCMDEFKAPPDGQYVDNVDPEGYFSEWFVPPQEPGEDAEGGWDFVARTDPIEDHSLTYDQVSV